MIDPQLSYNELENVAITMHCNLKPPDVAPALITTPIPSFKSVYKVFSVDTLRYTETLIFDLLTLNVCTVCFSCEMENSGHCCVTCAIVDFTVFFLLRPL